MSKKVAIIGASGLVGGNCWSHFKQYTNWQVVGTFLNYPVADLFFFDTLNLQNPQNFDLKSFAPDIIIHCGAMANADYAEQHEQESFEKTVQSTQNLVDLAKAIQAKLVYISTDYLFDGLHGPYLETDQPNPLSIYGRHKLAAEACVKNQLPENHLIARITNVYGDELRHKNFIARILQQIQENKAIAIDLACDQFSSPINAADIARMLQLLIEDEQQGIFNLASTDYLNRVQIAQLVAKHFPKHPIQITGKTTQELKQTAKRPLLAGLSGKKFAAHYPNFEYTNIDDYLYKKATKK